MKLSGAVMGYDHDGVGFGNTGVEEFEVIDGGAPNNQQNVIGVYNQWAGRTSPINWYEWIHETAMSDTFDSMPVMPVMPLGIVRFVLRHIAETTNNTETP